MTTERKHSVKLLEEKVKKKKTQKVQMIKLMGNRRHKIREVVQKVRHLLNRKFRKKDDNEKRLLKK